MNKKFNFLIFIFLIVSRNCSCQDDLAKNTESLQSTGQSIISGIKSLPEMLKGMIYESCSEKAIFNAKIINDLPKEIFITIDATRAIIGMQLPTETLLEKEKLTPLISAQKISPYNFLSVDDKKGVCHINLTLRWPESEVKLERTSDISEDDKDYQFYHTFSLNGKEKAEFMGPGYYGGPYTFTKDFEGVFFNNTKTDCKLKFTKNKQDYKVTLIAGSFNILSSVVGSEDIRTQNKFFTFELPNKEIKIPIKEEGLGQTYKIEEDKGTKDVKLPLTYRYEIFEKNKDIQVGIQGFNMGNYNSTGFTAKSNPTKISTDKTEKLAPIRDISPIECIIDYKAPAIGEIFKEESLWALYITKDCTIIKQLKLGEKNSFFIVRPQTKENPLFLDEESKLSSQGEAQLYVFSIYAPTINISNKIEDFLKSDYVKKELKNRVVIDISSKFNIKEASNITTDLGDIQPIIILEDKTNNITATLILVDTFLSYSGSMQAQKTYEVTASTFDFNDLTNIVTPYLDLEKFNQDQKTEFLKNLTEKTLPNWLRQINSSKISPQKKQELKNFSKIKDKSQLTNIVPDLTSFLKKYGYKNLFESTGSPTKLGFFALHAILFGSISLNNPPISPGYGTNSYLYGSTEKT